MKEKLKLCIIVILSCLVWNAYAADDKQGLAALYNSAKKGDAQSQLEYGKAIYYQNQFKYGTDAYIQSRAEAAEWIQKAADQGLGEAWFWLGYAGLGKEEPVFYYKKAAATGYAEAFKYLFDSLLFRAANKANVSEAKKYADLARKLNINFFNSAGQFETIDRCYEAGSPIINISDQPTSEEKDNFKNSGKDCRFFQFGINTSQDWNQYRKCILSQEFINNNELAEIYANGWGVQRNPNLAIALVCHGSSVPMELEIMVEELYSTKDQLSLESEFHFCDYVTSAMNSETCSTRAAEVAEIKRENEYNNLISQWTKTEKDAFHALKSAANDFFYTRSINEQDMTGTERVTIANAEESRLKNNFLNDIKDFESAKFPQDNDFKKADKDLNLLYRRIMKKNNLSDYHLSEEGIKFTQRKWLKYRDALVNFVKVRYSNNSPDLWQTKLTRERIEQLKEFVS